MSGTLSVFPSHSTMAFTFLKITLLAAMVDARNIWDHSRLRNDDVLVLSFQALLPACFSTAWSLSGVEGLEDLAGAGVALGSHAQSAACAG
jgi:hypothetical protein